VCMCACVLAVPTPQSSTKSPHCGHWYCSLSLSLLVVLFLSLSLVFLLQHKKNPSETPFLSVVDTAFDHQTEGWVTSAQDGDDFDLDSSLTLNLAPASCIDSDTLMQDDPHTDVAAEDRKVERTPPSTNESVHASEPTDHDHDDLRVSDFFLL
jgi:hypothetical protein